MRYRLEFVSEYRSDDRPKGAWCVYDTQDADFGLESFDTREQARVEAIRLNHNDIFGDFCACGKS